MVNAAIWIRVSDEDQNEGSQVPDIERFAAARGFTIVKRYTLHDASAWKNGGSPEYREQLRQLKQDAHAGHFSVTIVWALDRIVRLGAEEALRLNRELRERGVTLMSVQESWLNTSPEVQDVLLSFAGWMAEQESRRRSARVKLGIQRRREAGLPVGAAATKAKGITRGPDKKPRRGGSGRAWTPERRAPLAERNRIANPMHIHKQRAAESE
jgi:DNA invertase Pin-like site-specific DNA recombinase